MSRNIKYHINEYHKYYEEERIWSKNSWFGVPCWKLPFDMMVVQELIVKHKPDWIIETGTGIGGSVLFYASICEMLGHGNVVTVDIENRRIDNEQWHNRTRLNCEDRIRFLVGDSVSPDILNYINEIVGTHSKCMVMLDSWHSKDHVFKEMELYSVFVPKGGYMIVEDSHAAGNPVPWTYDDEGPMGAIKQWMEMYGKEWEIDTECEKHGMSFNPHGYLRRI